MEILGLGLTILANCAKFYDTRNRYKASDIKLDKDSIHSWKGCSIAAAADAALSVRALSLYSIAHCYASWIQHLTLASSSIEVLTFELIRANCSLGFWVLRRGKQETH